jgi:hypothetical protein
MTQILLNFFYCKEAFNVILVKFVFLPKRLCLSQILFGLECKGYVPHFSIYMPLSFPISMIAHAICPKKKKKKKLEQNIYIYINRG